MATGAIAALTFPFRRENAPSSYRAHVTHAVLRKLTSSLTLRQIQCVAIDRLSPHISQFFDNQTFSRMSTTTASYESYSVSKGTEPRIVSWGETGKGHWIGNHDASNVLVWFHGMTNHNWVFRGYPYASAYQISTGGNYYAPAHPAHFEFLHNLFSSLRQLNKDFAIFVPSYSLAPHAQYPTQLLEGLEVLRFLVEKECKLARNIVIGGDSAGGNLVLGILSHIAHPHPEISGSFFPDEPFAGALMFSPWVTFDQAWPSVERNRAKDCIPLLPNSTHAKYFLGDKPPDNYNEPLSAPVEWWMDIQARRLLLVTGQDDIMVDSHQAFAKILEVSIGP